MLNFRTSAAVFPRVLLALVLFAGHGQAAGGAEVRLAAAESAVPTQSTTTSAGRSAASQATRKIEERLFQQNLEQAASPGHRIRLEGRELGFVKSAAGLELIFSALDKNLKRSPKSQIRLEIDNEKFILDLPALGEGMRGAVYAISGTDQVLKLPKGLARDFMVLVQEDQAALDWEQARAQHAFSFKIPYRGRTHPLGLYSIKPLVTGETLDEFLFRYRVYDLNKTGQAQLSRRAQDLLSKDPRVQKVMKAVLEMTEIIRQHPELDLSLSPHNIMVSYADAHHAHVSDVTLIDLGLRFSKSQKYLNIKTAHEYLQDSLNSVNGDIARGRGKYKTKTFAATQTDENNILAKNLQGEALRIAGVTADLYETLRQRLQEFLKEYPQVQFREGYFYGSRVMTRSEVKLRHQNIDLPIQDDGVNKTTVRDGGLTSVSDLEIVILLDSPQELSYEYLSEMKFKFRDLLGQEFMSFPLSAKFMVRPQGQTYLTDFQWMADHSLKHSDRELSPVQYVKFADVQIPRTCEQVLGF